MWLAWQTWTCTQQRRAKGFQGRWLGMTKDSVPSSALPGTAAGQHMYRQRSGLRRIPTCSHLAPLLESESWPGTSTPGRLDRSLPPAHKSAAAAKPHRQCSLNCTDSLRTTQPQQGRPAGAGAAAQTAVAGTAQTR